MVLNQCVTIFCCRYVYFGRVVEVTDTHVTLADCELVLETGKLGDRRDLVSEKFPHNWSIAKQAIESWGELL
jgi:hypothetical protein